jgi:molecular chaperone DnaJ
VFGQFVQQRACPDCGGAGERLESPCADCGGDGRRVERRQLDLDVPVGIQDGQRIRIRGEGHAGYRGAEAGNAFVVVRVRPDPRFVRDGDDLHAAVRIPMTDAALGATVPVPTFAGDVELDIPPGTQPGAVRVLRGQGMPALRGSRRGDLHVRIDVAVPTRLTEEQRTLLDGLREGIGADAYDDPGDEGFFSRLRSALR